MRLPVLALLLALSAAAQETAPWPAGLEEAAAGHLAELREGQRKVELSTREAPLGIEQTQRYDRASHSCHIAPVQVARRYGSPRPRHPLEDGRHPVRFPYAVRYRKAATLEALFESPWSEGSGGELEVIFMRVGDAWKALSSREVARPLR